jgi:phosphohistidine phosphatase
MKLYLVQHGDALPKESDPRRPLSDRGRVDVERMAGFFSKSGLRAVRVLHSGKLRAEQTAKLLAASVSDASGAGITDGINPLDSVEEFAPSADSWTQDTMVVGHQPFMGRLVSHLVSGNAEAVTVSFKPGTIVCLERGEGGGWSIAWMMRPELLTGGEEDHTWAQSA